MYDFPMMLLNCSTQATIINKRHLLFHELAEVPHWVMSLDRNKTRIGFSSVSNYFEQGKFQTIRKLDDEIGFSKEKNKHPKIFQPIRKLDDQIERNLQSTTEQEKYIKETSCNKKIGWWNLTKSEENKGTTKISQWNLNQSGKRIMKSNEIWRAQNDKKHFSKKDQPIKSKITKSKNRTFTKNQKVYKAKSEIELVHFYLSYYFP